MNERATEKITISLPKYLVDLADKLAREQSRSRSAVIAELLKSKEEARVQALMAEGYREMSKGNLQEAEEALNLT